MPASAVMTNFTPVNVWKLCSLNVSVSSFSIPEDGTGATYWFNGGMADFVDLAILREYIVG